MRVFSKQGLASFALCLLGSTAAHAELPLVGIIAQGRAVIDLRARYERVTDNSKAFDANAGTVRARLGYDTGYWNNLQLDLNVSPKTVLNALSGNLAVSRTESRTASDFLAFQGDGINWPDPRKARWLYAEIVTGLRQKPDEGQAQAAAAVFRPDVFDAAPGNNAPPEAQDPIGLHFGPAFDVSDLKAYIDALMRG